MIVIGRGGLQMKPIAVIDAYQYGSASQGHLILNGIFTASHFSISSRFIERTKGDEKKFLEILIVWKFLGAKSISHQVVVRCTESLH